MTKNKKDDESYIEIGGEYDSRFSPDSRKSDSGPGTAPRVDPEAASFAVTETCDDFDLEFGDGGGHDLSVRPAAGSQGRGVLVSASSTPGAEPRVDTWEDIEVRPIETNFEQRDPYSPPQSQSPPVSRPVEGSRPEQLPKPGVRMPSATATRTAMDFLSKVFGEDCINGMASYEGEWAQKLENLETELKKMRTLKADADSAREKLEQQFDTFKSRASSLKQEAERRLKERAKEITELNEDLKEKDQQLNDKDQELKQTNLRLDEAKGQVEELSQTRTDLERQLLETQERPRNDLLSDISKSFGQECSIYQVLSTLSWEDLNVAGNCCLYVLPKIKPKGGAGVGMNLQYGIEIGRRFLEPIYELDIPKRQDLLNAAADHMSQIDPKYVFQNVERGLFNSDLHQGKPTRQGQRIRRMESFLVLNSSNKNVVAKAAVILED